MGLLMSALSVVNLCALIFYKRIMIPVRYNFCEQHILSIYMDIYLYICIYTHKCACAYVCSYT